MAEFVPEQTQEFLADAWRTERPTISGQGRWPDLLGEVLARWDLVHHYDGILGVWHRMEASAESVSLVTQVRAAGPRCALATNQDAARAEVMQAEFDYATLFDATYYSCDLGVAKPDPAYFRLVLDDLGLDPEQALFIDDTARNVAAARELGLRAEQWSIAEGHDVLRGHLRRHAALPAAD
ncbi:HAD family hydrolase [Occultella glacieicola]|uniref:HAD family hydrolase n=2 Tax=Occultella glacieicola TaxID=2518684 RepID=A0ABY2E6G1_9MICO|nr:HAD family hydrolase [Occultella glacieicola]